MAKHHFNCVARLNQAAGRKLSDSEVEDIFERVHQSALKMKTEISAGGTPSAPGASKHGPSIDQVIARASQEAAIQYLADAQRTQRNAALSIVRLSQRQDDAKAITGAGISPVESVVRTIVNRADGRSNAFSMESRYIGIATDMKRRIQDTWLALGRDFLGFVQDAEKIALLVREMRGEATGNSLAAKGAKAWLDMAEDFRLRFNDAGGQIGKLDNWGLPQHHSQELVARAGKDVWVNAVLPALDRAKYVDDAGRSWNDAELRNFLGKAWQTIATNGYANLEPGKGRGTGSVANRHAEERQIHFKDANAYLNYWGQFGEKTFPQILMGHVDRMARDLAMIEHYGPNPEAAYRTLRDEAVAAQAKADPSAVGAVEKQASALDNAWNTASGRTRPVADRTIAATFGVLRDLNVAGKLGSAFWASLYGDKVLLEAVSRLNSLPAIQNWMNELRLLAPGGAQERRMLQRQGLMLEYMTQAMARFGDDFGRERWSGKLANAVMRVSGMQSINDLRRGSFGLTLMSSLGHMVRTQDFSAATDADMHLMKSWGITEHDWKVWKLAKPTDLGHGNVDGLTPDAIARITDDELRAANIIAQAGGAKDGQRVRQEAITKLLGAIGSESRLAIIEPGWRERSQMYANLQPGTWKGELIGAFWQFKSFPIAQFERIWDLAMSRPSFGGKAGTLGAIMMMQTMAGAMMIQTQEMLTGKDPRAMGDWKFWLSAFIKGGSLGLYGDFLYNATETRQGTGPIEAFAGPTIGSALDFLSSSLKAARATSEGKETHLAAKYLQIGKGFIPGNNLWYTKAATDHLIFQNAQEALSPGYLANVKAKTQKDFGQAWWWEPGETTPERAPNFDRAFEKR